MLCFQIVTGRYFVDRCNYVIYILQKAVEVAASASGKGPPALDSLHLSKAFLNNKLSG